MNSINRVDVMTKAIQLRKELGEDSSSPIDIFSIARGIEGLSLVFYPMGSKLSGMCVKGNYNTCTIGINSEMSMGRQRFSLAHEFYHMRFDDMGVSLCGKTIGDGKRIEKEADIFASYFLMPNDELTKKVKSLKEKNFDGILSLDDIIRIEQYFGVSHQATVLRLKENQLISQDQTENYLQMSVKKRAKTMGYSGELYEPTSAGKQYGTYGAYIEQANLLLQKDLISEGKYESLLLEAFRPDLVYGEDEDGDIVD